MFSTADLDNKDINNNKVASSSGLSYSGLHNVHCAVSMFTSQSKSHKWSKMPFIYVFMEQDKLMHKILYLLTLCVYICILRTGGVDTMGIV